MKQDFPKVSIGVVTYNHENYIVECLDSIRLQTYPNIEVFIADDASTDKNFEIILDYNKNHPGFITSFYSHPNNVGISKNCNSLLDKMDGKYVHIFAGDDIMMPQKIERQVTAMEENPDAVICFTNTEWFWSENGKKICNHFGFLQKPSTDIKDILADCTIPTPTILYRKKLINNLRFNPELKTANDYYFAIEALQMGKAIYLSEVCVRYRKHKNSTTANNFFPEDRRRIVSLLLNRLPEQYHPYIKKYEKTIIYAEVMSYASKNKRLKALKLWLKLLPATFYSRKWTIRIFHSLYYILVSYRKKTV